MFECKICGKEIKEFVIKFGDKEWRISPDNKSVSKIVLDEMPVLKKNVGRDTTKYPSQSFIASCCGADIEKLSKKELVKYLGYAWGYSPNLEDIN